MKQKLPLTSIIIPAYNEEKNITKVIKSVLALSKKFHLEIIVVDDGSKDNTAKVAKKAGANKVIYYKNNKGKGGAFRMGIDKAKGDYIIQIDADHQFQPNEIPLFIKELIGGSDIVCGTRFDKGKIEKGSVSQINLFGNWLMSSVTTFFSGIRVTDIMAGFKGFTKEAANKLNLVTQHFGYEAEVVVKAGKLNLKVKEIPITYTKRAFGSSSVSAIKDGIRVSYTIAKMYLTFPGPLPGHGVVGKRILSLIIPIWFIIILPLLGYLTSRSNGANSPFETQYIISFLMFFTTLQLTKSRFSALIASAFLAVTPLTYTNFSTFIFFLPTAILSWFTLLGFTIIFLQEKKVEFSKNAFVIGLFINLCLFFLQDQNFLLNYWLSIELSIFGLLLASHFWYGEKRISTSMVFASFCIIASVVTTGALLNLVGLAILVGTLTACLFLETISFRIDKSPLFSFHRVVKAFLLAFFVTSIFFVKIINIL